MKCIACQTKMTTARETYLYKSSGLPNVTLKDIEVSRCPSCGEYEVAIPHVEALHHALALAVISKRARLTSEEVRFLRKFLGWTGEDTASTLGVTRETVSQWEDGASPVCLSLVESGTSWAMAS
jgi:putative zinc finger/helix-turn-helix YgiT family protein